MKPKTTIATRTTEPLLSLRAQVLYRNRDGQIRDVTHEHIFGLKKLAENAELAAHILNECQKRLDLLFMAAERRPHIDAGLVRLAVEDLRSQLEASSQLAGFVGLMHELFSNSEALAPEQTAGAPKTTGRATGLARGQRPAIGMDVVSSGTGRA